MAKIFTGVYPTTTDKVDKENLNNVTQHPNLKYLQDLEHGMNGCWVKVFGWLPIIGRWFIWSDLLHHRDSLTPANSILKPGLFSFRTLYDTITLKWLSYLKEAKPPDTSVYSICDSAKNEYGNCGVVSALIFSIQTNFVLYPPLEFENVSTQVTYRVLVSTSMFSSSVGMVTSILLLLCLNETGSREEGEHFLKILDASTFGLGSHFQFVCLVISCLSGVLGNLQRNYIHVYLKETCTCMCT